MWHWGLEMGHAFQYVYETYRIQHIVGTCTLLKAERSIFQDTL